MILHWQQLPLHFGESIDIHRPHFEMAHRATYGLLCCRFTPGNDQIERSSGDHAEQRLLASPLWQVELPRAMEGYSTLQHSKLLVVMVINRSPCPGCSNLLRTALARLQMQYALRFQHSRFVIASLGVYEGSAGATTDQNLRALHDAGWELAVLQVGNDLTANGRQLLQGIQRVTGIALVTPTRLDG